jgi:hypothetical protein
MNSKLVIPIALIGALVSFGIWISGLALATEHRVTRCETVQEVVVEMRDTIKDIQFTQVRMMLDIQRLSTKIGEDSHGR